MPEFELGTFSLGSLIGLLLGAFIGHSLAIRRGKALAKFNAAIIFKQAITPALVKLENGDSQFSVIQEAFENHYEASIIYSSYLKGRELKEFKGVLSEYRHWQVTMYDRDTSEVLYDTEDPEYLKEKAKNPVQILEKLLEY